MGAFERPHSLKANIRLPYLLPHYEGELPFYLPSIINEFYYLIQNRKDTIMKKIIKYFLVSTVVLAGTLNFAQQPSGLPKIQSPGRNIVKRLALTPISEMSTSALMRLTIALPLRNQSGLNTLLSQVYNPLSSQWHQYLSVSQFTNEFGPSSQDYDSLISS